MDIRNAIVKYGKLIENVKGTPFEDEPWLGVQVFFNHDWNSFEYHPEFNILEKHNMRFAVGILEGRLVFPGDDLTNTQTGEVLNIGESEDWIEFVPEGWDFTEDYDVEKEKGFDTNMVLTDLFISIEYRQRVNTKSNPVNVTFAAKDRYANDREFRQIVDNKVTIYLDLFRQLLGRAW